MQRHAKPQWFRARVRRYQDKHKGTFMKSPCRAACKNNGGICSGCHRTMNEIVQWKDKTDAQRDAIIEQIAGNQTTHSCPECGTRAHCEIAEGKESCWCFDIESRDLPKPLEGQLCLCRQCLEKKPVA